MEASVFFGLGWVALALYVGLSEIADAIRKRNITVTLPDPIVINLNKD